MSFNFLNKNGLIEVWANVRNYVSSLCYSKAETNTLLSAKAADNTVVHLAGSETITGTKTFTDSITLNNSITSSSYKNFKIIGTNMTRGVTGNVTCGDVQFQDKNNAILGLMRNRVDSNLNTITELQARNINASNAQTYTTLSLTMNKSGTPLLRWDDADILTKVNGVDLASDQSISGKKTFQNGLVEERTLSGQFNGAFIIKNNNVTKTGPVDIAYRDYISFGGSDFAQNYATTIGQISMSRYTDNDATYAGHNSLELRISSNANTSTSGMATLRLFSTGALKWNDANVITENTLVLAFSTSAVNYNATVAGSNLKVAIGGLTGFTASSVSLSGTYKALCGVSANGVGLFVKAD